MLSLVKLISFVKVAESGSFSRAALLLGTAHSGLSRQVAELEAELGYRLLQRTGRGVRLTEAGHRLYLQARQLISQAQAVHDEAVAIRGVPVGTVTIGMPGSVAMLLGSQLLVQASDKYPQVKIRLIEGLSASVEEQLATGRVDFGLYFAAPDRPVARATPLYLSDLYLVGPPGDSLFAKPTVPTSCLRRLRLILPGAPNAIRVAVEHACAQAGFACNVAYEADSLSTMKRAIEVGAGHTVTGWESMVREVETGALAAARLVSPPLSRVMNVEIARVHPLTMAAGVILREVQALAQALRKDAKLRLREVRP